MVGTLLKVAIGFVAGAALSPEAKDEIRKAAGAVARDLKGHARKGRESVKEFWDKNVKPTLDGDARPPGGGQGPTASA